MVFLRAFTSTEIRRANLLALSPNVLSIRPSRWYNGESRRSVNDTFHQGLYKPFCDGHKTLQLFMQFISETVAGNNKMLSLADGRFLLKKYVAWAFA